jgi:hypothetical protein
VRTLLSGLLTLLLAGWMTTAAHAAGRSFEECQARAVALGLRPSSAGKVESKYLRYKAAGTALHPKGFVARCMAGTG